MTEQITYTIISACFGFVAAIFFCIGSALLDKRKTIKIATTMWGFNQELAKTTISQSIQYGVGGLLLIASFCLQVAAILASPTKLLGVHPILSQPVWLVLLTLTLIGALSFALYSVLKKWWEPQVLKELRKSKKYKNPSD